MPTRQKYSRESSYDSIVSSTSHTSTGGSLYHRRNLRRLDTTCAVPSLDGFPEFFNSRTSKTLVAPLSSSDDLSDEERWRRMLQMQRQYHCYKSARIEAAVAALERGENPPMPSKLCLDLLNDELKAQMEAARVPR